MSKDSSVKDSPCWNGESSKAAFLGRLVRPGTPPHARCLELLAAGLSDASVDALLGLPAGEFRRLLDTAATRAERRFRQVVTEIRHEPLLAAHAQRTRFADMVDQLLTDCGDVPPVDRAKALKTAFEIHEKMLQPADPASLHAQVRARDFKAEADQPGLFDDDWDDNIGELQSDLTTSDLLRDMERMNQPEDIEEP